MVASVSNQPCPAGRFAYPSLRCGLDLQVLLDFATGAEFRSIWSRTVGLAQAGCHTKLPVLLARPAQN